MGLYSTNSSSTSSSWGLGLNSIEFGHGTDGSGPMLLASYRLVGTGYYIVRANSSTNVALNINTTNPQFFESTGNLILQVDSVYNIKQSGNIRSPAKMNVNHPAIIFIPTTNTFVWGLAVGGGEPAIWNYVGINKGQGDRLDDTFEAGKTWWQAGPSGIFSSPSSTMNMLQKTK